MTPCPHCGTPNGADSETCLCCGKRMQELPQDQMPANSADGEAAEAPATTAVQSVSAAGMPGEDAGETPKGKTNSGDAPAPLSPQQKRKRRLFIGLAVVSNVLLLSMVLVQALYLNAPGYRTARLFQSQSLQEAQQIYLQKVAQDEGQTRLLRREMKKYFDELDAQYRDGTLNFVRYTAQCGDILRLYLDDDINQYVRTRFHREAEQAYEGYRRWLSGEGGMDYVNANYIFICITNNELMLDDRTAELMGRFYALKQDELYFSSAQTSEQAMSYSKALGTYRKIRPESPRYEAAGEGAQRCVTAYCADLRTKIDQSDRYAQTMRKFRDEAGTVLALWPENGALQQLYEETRSAYQAAVKQEALAAAEAPGNEVRTIVVVEILQHALEEVPGDSELQTAYDRCAQRLKAEMYRELPEMLCNEPAGLYEVAGYLDEVYALLKDPEILSLLERLRDFQENRLYTDLANGADDLFIYEKPVSYEGDQWMATFYTMTPAADAFGVRHAPYALHRFTADPGSPARCSILGGPYTALRCKVFADPGCTGSGVLELWVSYDRTEQTPMEKYWTSPVLNRTTNGYEVNISLPQVGYAAYELRLVSRTGTVVLLLDEAYLERG